MLKSGQPEGMRPLYLGCLVIRHEGCWAADTTSRFPTVTLDIAVTGYDTSSYELYVIIKPKDGAFDELTQEKIASFINLHRIVQFSSILFQTDNAMLMQLRIVDGGGPRGAFRSVVMYGSILTEICHHVEDGKEYVWGAFESVEAHTQAVAIAKLIYGPGIIEDSETWISETSGLVEGPRLFSESLLCNSIEFSELRKMVDQLLRNGSVDGPTQEKWPAEFYQKCSRFIAELAKKAKDIIVIKTLAEVISTILFPDLPPIDP